MVELDRWVSEILSDDPTTFEDAYWGERPPAKDAVPVLVDLLQKYHDPFNRGKIIELLGESEDISIMYILENELKNPDEGIRNWATGAIQSLGKLEKWHQGYDRK